MTAPAKAAPMREDVTKLLPCPFDCGGPVYLDADDGADGPQVCCQGCHTKGPLADWSEYKTDGEAIASAVSSWNTRLAHTARPDAGDEDVERVAAFERFIDVVDRFTVQPHRSNIIHDAIIEARAALAAMREGVDRGMVERVGINFDVRAPFEAVRDDGTVSRVSSTTLPSAARMAYAGRVHFDNTKHGWDDRGYPLSGLCRWHLRNTPALSPEQPR